MLIKFWQLKGIWSKLRNYALEHNFNFTDGNPLPDKLCHKVHTETIQILCLHVISSVLKIKPKESLYEVQKGTNVGK